MKWTCHFKEVADNIGCSDKFQDFEKKLEFGKACFCSEVDSFPIFTEYSDKNCIMLLNG